jgi:hypothetical protein
MAESKSRRVLLGSAIAVVSVLIVVVAVLLVRGPDEPGVPPATASAADAVEQARAGAIAASERFWAKLEQASATNNEDLLDGLYVPGSKVEASQRQVVQGQIERNETSHVNSRTLHVVARDVTTTRAVVVVTRRSEGGEIRDATTKRVKFKDPGRLTSVYTMIFTKSGGSWLLETLTAEAKP